MSIRCLKTAFLAVAVLVLSAVPASAATLSFEHASTQVTDTSPVPDGIISPGDTFTLRERVLNNTLTPLSSLSGTLTATGGVSILQGASPLDVVAFGQETFNSTLFQAHVPTGTECGANLDFSLGLTSGADATSVPFTVGTGVAGSSRAYDSADVPRPIPDGGKVASSLVVADVGRVKDLRVRIGRITHPYDSDLTATLIAPDGTRVELFRGIGGSGDNFVDTVLTTQGVPLSGIAPFTGSWRVDALRGLAGHAMQGTWKLEVSDATNADAGTLDAWGLDLTPATCAPQPIASFSVAPASPAPGVSVTFNATGSTDPVGTIVKYEWDLDGNGTYEINGGTSPTTSTTYATRGARTVALRVTDNLGLVDVTTRSVSVSQAPIASFFATPASPTSGQLTTPARRTTRTSAGSSCATSGTSTATARSRPTVAPLPPHRHRSPASARRSCACA
jgi:subtilisin-like proprotein convertase family protein